MSLNGLWTVSVFLAVKNFGVCMMIACKEQDICNPATARLHTVTPTKLHKRERAKPEMNNQGKV